MGLRPSLKMTQDPVLLSVSSGTRRRRLTAKRKLVAGSR